MNMEYIGCPGVYASVLLDSERFLKFIGFIYIFFFFKSISLLVGCCWDICIMSLFASRVLSILHFLPLCMIQGNPVLETSDLLYWPSLATST